MARKRKKLISFRSKWAKKRNAELQKSGMSKRQSRKALRVERRQRNGGSFAKRAFNGIKKVAPFVAGAVGIASGLGVIGTGAGLIGKIGNKLKGRKVRRIKKASSGRTKSLFKNIFKRKTPIRKTVKAVNEIKSRGLISSLPKPKKRGFLGRIFGGKKAKKKQSYSPVLKSPLDSKTPIFKGLSSRSKERISSALTGQGFIKPKIDIQPNVLSNDIKTKKGTNKKSFTQTLFDRIKGNGAEYFEDFVDDLQDGATSGNKVADSLQIGLNGYDKIKGVLPADVREKIDNSINNIKKGVMENEQKNAFANYLEIGKNVAKKYWYIIAGIVAYVAYKKLYKKGW